MHKPTLTIHQIPVPELNPAPYNPRTWDEGALVQLCESIQRFGFLDPVIANNHSSRKNVVIGGHMRLAAAKKLGMSEVPVIFVAIPSLKKEQELNLRLNRNTGQWDFDLLKKHDLDLLLEVGFDDSDLSHIWDEALSIEDDAFDVEKAIEEIKNPQTKLGDLFQLGDHFLLCGDSLELVNVKRLVGQHHPSMLYFDPPYNISLDYNKGVATQGKYGGQFQSDNKSRVEYKNFLSQILTNGLAISSPECHVFTWCDQNWIGLIQEVYQDLGIDHKRVCLWIKNNANMTPQVGFNKCFEPCVYGTRGNPFLAPIHNLNEILNKEVGTGNRTIDDILDVLDIWLVKRLAGQDYEHPTAKPPTLHEKPLRRCTKPGDSVLDLFGGSGSTLMACEQLKRQAFLCELDPIFCDVIIKRFQELTGKEAILCQ
jgi:DNA modification methylase